MDHVFGRILGVVGRLLVAAGLVVLGFVAFQLWGTGLETARGQSELTSSLAAEAGDDVDSEVVDLEELAEQLAAQDPATAPATPAPPRGDPVGVIAIPRIGLLNVMVEGVSREELKKGPAHYPGTPLPGQAGNAGIAGHRTTYGAPFNRIDELVPGDEITIVTPQGEFVYEVIPAPGQTEQAWYVVSPSQVEVLADMGDNRITLTACHPKYSARQRIIVHAVLQTDVAPTATALSTDGGSDVAGEQAAADEAAEEFDQGLGADSDALPPALAFGGAAAAVALAAWGLGRHLRRSLVWVVATPAIVVLIWFSYVYMDQYLPAI